MDYREIIESNDSVIIKGVKNFNIKQILECGQCFRWQRVTDTDYIVVSNRRVIEITQEDDQVIIHNTNMDDFKNIWENYFDEESSINEYALTLFVKQENGLFARFEEFHYQRAYELQRVAALLEQAGLTLKAVCAEGTTDPADENSERAYFVAVRTQPHVF